MWRFIHHIQTHTHQPILSQCPEGRSFVCVRGLKCCWQVKINPTLLFSFLVPFLAVHFLLSLFSVSHLFSSFIQPCFSFLLIYFILICFLALSCNTVQCHVLLSWFCTSPSSPHILTTFSSTSWLLNHIRFAHLQLSLEPAESAVPPATFTP